MRARAELLVLIFTAAMSAALSIPAAAAEIRVGLAAPLTGRMAEIGLAMQKALKQAVAETNAAGGVLGQPLHLAVEDDGCASATAEGAARRLIAETSVLVIGHPCSNAATATVTIYGQAGVLLIAVGPRHSGVTRAASGLAAPALRMAGRDDRQGDVAASWLFDNAPHMRMAIVHDRTGYARAIVDGVNAKLKVSGITPVATLSIVAGKRDYAGVAVELKKSGAESVLFAGYPEEATILISAMEKAGLAVPVLGVDALATPEFAEFAERTKMRVQVLLPAEITPRTESGDNDHSQDGNGARARGALEAWLETVRKTGSTDGRTLAAAMRGVPIQTRSVGEIQFDLNGDLDAEPFATASASQGRWTQDD